jgi:hypothetical protein
MHCVLQLLAPPDWHRRRRRRPAVAAATQPTAAVAAEITTRTAAVAAVASPVPDTQLPSEPRLQRRRPVQVNLGALHIQTLRFTCARWLA